MIDSARLDSSLLLAAQRPPRWRMSGILAAWTIPAILGATYAVVSAQALPVAARPPAWRLGLAGFVAWIAWALITPAIERLADRVRVQRPLAFRPLSVHLAAAIAACAAQAVVVTMTTFWISGNPGTSPARAFEFWFLTLLPAGVVVYAAVVGARSAEIHHAESLARAQAADRLSAELGRAQLSALRAQLQPHFLFNTLNAVIALVRANENADAVEALLMLSDLLRATLRVTETPEVTLGEELEFVEHYLAIERLRFGDRLTVAVSGADDARDVVVPTFILQPFIENAIKHGLRDRTSDGRVSIDVSCTPEQLHVRIHDNGVGLSTDWESRCAAGHGVTNTRTRLQRLYGDAAWLELRAPQGREGTIVDITLPLRHAPVDTRGPLAFA